MPAIFFTQRGAGKPVILLHGFPMNQSVWNDFAEELSQQYKVFTPDLPGLGQSEILSLPFSIDAVADSLLAWIAAHKIENSVLIGHSLGGYVALAMLEKKPELFAGIGLFHSTAYADSAERKESRTKVVEFVSQHGALAFTSKFIQPLFTSPNHPSIPKVSAITTQASADAVKGYTIAMRDRPDRMHVLTKSNKPMLFIAGVNDTGIPADTITRQALLCQYPDVHILEDVAHMGMFEKPAETLTIVKTFLASMTD